MESVSRVPGVASVVDLEVLAPAVTVGCEVRVPELVA